jgi:hypothetical protein
MRHGRTTPSKRSTGYKLHAEAPILTAVSLSPANEHDGHHAGALVDQQPERRRPTRLIGDTAYGNVETREQLEERSISVLAPVHTTSPRDGTIPRTSFRSTSRQTPSPAPAARRRRSTSPGRIGRARPASGSPASRAATASPAPLRARCSPGGQRDIRISRREDLRQAALQVLADPAERDHLKRTRPLIERLLGLIVHRYRGRKSRYRGARKSILQAVWTALLVNLHPIGAALRADAA